MGLSDLVKTNKIYSSRHEEVIFSGDYKVSQISNFIHALYFNRKGASDYYFTIDDLKTTLSEYKREKIIDLWDNNLNDFIHLLHKTLIANHYLLCFLR